MTVKFHPGGTRMKTGLVIEGGGVRGIYAAGVLDQLMEMGLHFDGVIGVSAGAIHGCSFLSGQKGRSIRYYKKYCADPRFMGLRSFLKTGDIVGADFCYHELPDRLDVYDHAAFLRCAIPFYVTCTNLATGRPEYLRLQDMRTQMDYMRASASMPYVSKIVELDGQKLLDGGVADSVPLNAFRQMGYDKNIVVLTQCAGYRKKPQKPREKAYSAKDQGGQNQILHCRCPHFSCRKQGKKHLRKPQIQGVML
jgi:predicted patatin/cPLA2 family phospholipase